MQYNEGLVTMTNSSAIVTGESTAWSTEVSAGDLFKLAGSQVIYQIATVDSDTQLTLAANYAGATATDQSYLICTDFTANYNFPEIHRGDRDWPDINRAALRMVDAKLAELDARITALE